MIISKTPVRISFAGGGTDLKEFYSKKAGSVTSTAINKYVYVTVNKKFDNDIRVSYSKTEIVSNVNDIQHELVREALKLTGITKGVEITSIADIPSHGTGLGSSSSFIVGLLNALYAYKGEMKSAKFLAEQACQIEIDILGSPIGKQDQYIAAFGGLQHIRFNPDESVFIDPVICSPSVKKHLQDSLLLFYTGTTRPSSSVLNEQRANTSSKMDTLEKMQSQSEQIKTAIVSGNLEAFGKLLNEGWLLKKQMASNISNSDIDAYYETAMKAGATGGKILGAGGGGFLLFFCQREKQDAVRSALSNLQETYLAFEPQGSKIIYVGD